MRALPDNLVLTVGSHSPNGEMCVMEAVAYVAEEPWSDHPECTCPVLRRFAIRINDAAWSSDAARTAALLPLVPLLVNATSTLEIRRRRMFYFADRAIHLFAPIALRARGKTDGAAKLEALPWAEPWLDLVAGRISDQAVLP